MKRFVMATALACALFGSALAGDVPTGDDAPPTPTESTNLVVPGDMPTGGSTQQGSTDITMTMVQVIFGLLSV